MMQAYSVLPYLYLTACVYFQMISKQPQNQELQKFHCNYFIIYQCEKTLEIDDNDDDELFFVRQLTVKSTFNYRFPAILLSKVLAIPNF